MERRNFLFGCGTIATVALAGCTSPDEDDTSNPNETPTETTPEATVTVTDHSFEVINSGPAEHRIGKATENEIIVLGTVDVKDGCTTIDLGSPPEMADSDPLTIKAMIGTKETGADTCTQAVRSVAYRLTMSVEGDPVDEIQISQGGVESQTTTLEVEYEDE